MSAHVSHGQAPHSNPVDPMSQLSPASFDLAQLSAPLVAELAFAADLADLSARATLALRAILPAHSAQLRWGDDVSPDASPEHALGRYPLRAAGQLLGWIELRPGDWSAEQEQWLSLLAAVVSPMALALRRLEPPPAIEQRRAKLLVAINRLRRASAPAALLHDLSGVIKAAFPFQDLFWMLRYDGDWMGMAYASLQPPAGQPPVYWKASVGLSGAVLRSGTPIYTDDYNAECVRRGIPPLIDERLGFPYAWYSAPLRDEGVPQGALITFSSVPHLRLSADDRELLAWLVDEVAPTVIGAQRYARAAEEASQRAALNLIARQINRSLNPDDVPNLIVERAPGLLNAEEASLLLLDAATGELEFRYAAGPAGHRLLGQRLPAGEGVAGFVASSGEPSIVNDTSADGRFYSKLDGASGFQTRSIVAVPLRGLDGVKGVIEVLNRRDNAPFTERDCVLLEALADHATIALENARQFASKERALARRAQELDRSNDRLVKILRASNAMRAERPIDDILGRLADVVVESSGFHHVMIALVHRERTPEPYLQVVARVGSPPPSPDAARMALVELEALLRPERRLGSLAYLIERRSGDYARLWGSSVTAAEGLVGSWRADDALFCLLRDSRGEISGLIGVDQPHDGSRPSAEQVQILEILANQAAAAIENAHLYARQQQNLSRMMALNGLGRALSTTLRSPRQIYELTASGMLEMSGARWAAVFLDDATSSAAPTLAIGTHPADTQTAAQLARNAIAARRPLSLHPAHTGEALLGIPLLGSSRCLGAICVGYGESLPDAGDVESLILFASQAASAVESLSLLSEIQLGRDQLASIMDSTREGMLLVGQAGRVEVANGAFLLLANAEAWPEQPATPAALATMALSDLLERWQATVNFSPVELDLLHGAVAGVANGSANFMLGQLNGAAPGARALEWSLLRAPREGSAASADDPVSWPILLTVRDISAAKEAERLRSDLTNMMVHDLRSPLASIVSSIDLIFRGITGAVTLQQRDVLAIAHLSTQKLLNMINLLLDISRLEGGRMPIEQAPLTVRELSDTALTAMHVLAESRGVTLEPELAEAAEVFADRELVLRVLQNLLDNALKFSPKGSRVRLSASMDGGGMVRFVVRDTGSGIRDSDLEQIFAKFGQSGNRRNSGSGLGLTFCKLVVETHGGRIWVESELGLGSSFFFTLPAAL